MWSSCSASHFSASSAATQPEPGRRVSCGLFTRKEKREGRERIGEGQGGKRTGAGDGLAVLLVLDVAGGEHALDAGLALAGLGNEVAVLVHVELALEQGGRGVVADGVKQALGIDGLLLLGDVVLDDELGHEAVLLLLALDLHRAGVVPDLDLGVRRQAACVGPAGPELVPAHEHRDLLRLLREIQRLFDRRVAAADDHEGLLAEHGERAVAHGACAHAVAPELLLAGEIQTAGLGARRDDERVRGVGGVFVLDGLVVAHGVEPVFEGAGGEVDLCHGLGDDFGAAGLGLLAHLVHELAALDHLETGEVLDFVRGRQLAAGGDTEREEALVHDG